jgi:hypothetical protein|tara:strand:- start:5500 stop:5868 length:369 start_codon:yes stop_codon:yes gene_type:complete
MRHTRADKCLVRYAYVQAIRERWFHDGEGMLRKDFDKDIHIGGEAPGNWSPNSLVEIYCEDGIPNASDVHSFAEIGGGTHYNIEDWISIDARANQLLDEANRSDLHAYTEAHNSAVLSVYLS